MRVVFVAGTRPEIIKISPVVHEMRQRNGLSSTGFDCRVIATGQHGLLADQAFSDVGIAPDVRLSMAPGAIGLTQCAAQILSAMGRRGAGEREALIVVQGDTNSALAGTMAGFYGNVPVAHIEAGLRTGDERDPFPEEANRRLIGRLAQLHFAPTGHAADNLRREGVADDAIAVTGNTVVDALAGLPASPPPLWLDDQRKLVTVTCHRRENWGERLDHICAAVRGLAAQTPRTVIAFPLHGNPQLAERIKAVLGGVPGIHLLPPLPFGAFVALLKRSALIITDSGGVQEEAVSLGRPVLVCRASSERPEGLASGLMDITGTDPATIIRRALDRLNMPPSGPPPVNPFGDGAAAPRIAEALQRWHAGIRPLLPAERQFSAPVRQSA